MCSVSTGTEDGQALSWKLGDLRFIIILRAPQFSCSLNGHNNHQKPFQP